ncbi:hypothetical protein BCT58_25430 [Vibrio lentus]|nr:hypothetical protein BCT58_25430 [Vibrio lentus]
MFLVCPFKKAEFMRREYPATLNDRVVVRSNDELKEAFEQLCLDYGYKPSNAIRMFMLKSVREWDLNINK